MNNILFQKILALKIRFEDLIIIIFSVITMTIIIILFYLRMNIQNKKHTTKLFIELEILMADLRKAIDRIKLFKRDDFKTEIIIHEQNYTRFRELVTNIQNSRHKNKNLKSIFDIEKKMNIDTNTIKRKIRKEIRTIISYLK